MTDKKSEIIRMIKFACFSLSAGVIQLGSDTLLLYVCHLEAWLSYLISLVLSVLWNFTFNRKFTFASSANVPIAMLWVALFYAVFTPATTYLTFWLTDSSMGIVWNATVVQIMIMALNLITEYLYQRYVVFRNSIDSAKTNK